MANNGAWYVKDFGDGWLKFADLGDAIQKVAETGAIMKWVGTADQITNAPAMPPEDRAEALRVVRLLLGPNGGSDDMSDQVLRTLESALTNPAPHPNGGLVAQNHPNANDKKSCSPDVGDGGQVEKAIKSAMQKLSPDYKGAECELQRRRNAYNILEAALSSTARPDNEALAAATREALFMAASHCQGGHSDAGYSISKVLGIPFPVTMENLVHKALEEGREPAELWPWLKPESIQRLRGLTDNGGG